MTTGFEELDGLGVQQCSAARPASVQGEEAAAAHQCVLERIRELPHMVVLDTVWYNYVKQHKSLKGPPPAMAAGVSDTLWSMTDLAEMVEASRSKPGLRGPYKKAAQHEGNSI